MLLNPAGNAGIGAYRIAVTPADLQGRVSATSQFVAMSVMPLSPLLGGVLLERYGGEVAIAVLALATAGLALLLTLSRTVRSVPHPSRWAAGRAPAGRLGAPGLRLAQPSAAGRVPLQAARSSSSGMPNCPSTDEVRRRRYGRSRPRVRRGSRPSRAATPGVPRARRRSPGAPTRRTARRTGRPRGSTVTPTPSAQRGLDQRLGEPAVGQVVRAGEQPEREASTQQPGQVLLVGEVDRGRPAAEVAVDDVGPLRAGELLAGLAEEDDAAPVGGEAGGRTPGDVVDHARARPPPGSAGSRSRRSGCRG